MTASIDPARLEAHLEALHAEVAELRSHLDSAAELQRELALQETLEALAPAIRALGVLDAASTAERRFSAESALGEELRAALGRLGLTPVGRAGEPLELWPEQAAPDRMVLDREVPDDATLVRVRLLAAGWALGEWLLAPPRGVVVEVVR